MGDITKALGIWAIFCILGSCIQCFESIVIGSMCNTGKQCPPGIGMSALCINCIMCISCLFLFFKALL